MPYKMDEKTGNITMDAGDTGDVNVEVEWEDLKDGDVVVFAVFDPAAKGDLLRKAAEFVDGSAHVRLANRDTRDIEPGRYKWNLRLVTDPAYDEDGNVRADEDSDNVITIFSPPPSFRLTRGGGDV